jgi:hypothetical protein
MSETEIPNLTIRDKLNVPYLLASQILTVQKAVLNTEFSKEEIREAVMGLLALIPDNWRDEEFEDELEEAKVTIKIDVRPMWCGVRGSLEYCKEAGIEPYEYKTSFGSFKVFHACINLLQRRGLMSQFTRIEKTEGVEFALTTKNY